MIAGIVLLVTGCGHGRMTPAQTAHVVPGAPNAAIAQDQGVRVAASAEDWRGRPVDLAKRVTPVKVRIVNHSGKPLRILYERFELTGARDRVYRPLPVVPIDHAQESTVDPTYGAVNFYVGPRYHDVYPSLPAWSQPLPRDGEFYGRQYQRWTKDLPSAEMQRMALPEGVLADGGQVSGFIYFEEATNRESRLLFRADLEDGNDGQPVASIEIPFRVE
jgi:hypothetical protein